MSLPHLLLNNVDNASPLKIEVLPSSLPSSWQGTTELAYSLISQLDNYCYSSLEDESCKKDEFDIPQFIVELDTLITQFRTWQALLPRVEPFYAVKCQPDPVVIQLLAALGCNFDCASAGELKFVTNLGISADRVILAHPCKVRSLLRLAADHQVGYTTTDSVEDVRKIAQYWPNARVLLRILPPKFPARCPLGLKFGTPKMDWGVIGQEARRLGVNIVGVAFHVGSACMDSNAWACGVELASEAIDFLASEEGGSHKLSMLDIGGGYPGEVSLMGGKSIIPLNIADSSSVEMPVFQAICCSLRIALDKFFPPERAVRIIAEPGRFFAHSTFHLITKVVNRRPRQDQETNTRGYTYFLNDGPYGSFSNVLFDHGVAPYPTVLSLQNPVISNRSKFLCKVYGPTCDEDPIAERCLLPELFLEDYLLWPNMGAYTSASASEFNGMPRANRSYFISEHLLPFARTTLMPYLIADNSSVSSGQDSLHHLQLRSGSEALESTSLVIECSEAVSAANN